MSLNNPAKERRGDVVKGKRKALRSLEGEVGRWTGTPRGATKVEYLVIIVAGFLVMVAIIQLFGGGLGYQFQRASDLLASDVNREGSLMDRGGSGGTTASTSSGSAGGASSRGDRQDREGGAGREGATAATGRQAGSEAGGGGAGRGGGSGSDSGALRGASGTSRGSGSAMRVESERSEPRRGSVGGINPAIWFIAIGLMLLLAYVMFGEKKG